MRLATSKLTSCFRMLAWFLASSHSNVIAQLYLQFVIVAERQGKIYLRDAVAGYGF